MIRNVSKRFCTLGDEAELRRRLRLQGEGSPASTGKTNKNMNLILRIFGKSAILRDGPGIWLECGARPAQRVCGGRVLVEKGGGSER